MLRAPSGYQEPTTDQSTAHPHTTLLKATGIPECLPFELLALRDPCRCEIVFLYDKMSIRNVKMV
jgi:hypothetical protein